ncbi:MAG TPA: ATP-binding protein [Xanthobacteraceae bacterium]|jgi:PAS domain S-box-containing protein|nr:ATP-binding protein [Xanthobacteraceae bacterium]
MTTPSFEQETALLRHPRLAALATSAWPAWLWRADGSQILWANAVAAAIFGAATVRGCVEQRFDVRGASAAQIIRLGATLPPGGQERLERLRGFGAGFNRALTCACSRIVVGDGLSAVLVVATEAAGPALPLAERVSRVFAEHDEAIAVFTAGGDLIYANAPAQAALPKSPSLAILGLEDLASKAFATGQASGEVQLNDTASEISALGIGKDDTRVLAMTFAPQAAVSAPSEPAPQTNEEPVAVVAAPLQDVTAPPEPTPQPETPVQLEITEQPQTLPEPDNVIAAEAETPAEAPIEATPDTASAVTMPDVTPEEPPTERRHPLRFVWHTDADGRFAVGSDEFSELVGTRTMTVFGRPWNDIAAELKLDTDSRVAKALASHETWSGLVVSWPVDDSSDRLPVELSGLPVFDRDRNFRGYRGFGVCRDIARINQLVRARREQPATVIPTPLPQQPQAEPIAAAPEPTPVAPPTPAEPPAIVEAHYEPERPAPIVVPPPPTLAPAAANVVPFRQSPAAPEPKAPPTLSPVERRAFRELAQELTARLRAPEENPAPAKTEPDAEPAQAAPAAVPTTEAVNEHGLLDRIPVGILVYRHDALLFANRHFLEWSGYDSLATIEAGGGVNMLFVAPSAEALGEGEGPQTLSILSQRGEKLPTEGRMFTVPWNGASALALILTNGKSQSVRSALAAAETENHALKAILDATTDGVLTLDSEGRIVAANARAASLFCRATGDFAGLDFATLLTPESETVAKDFFARTKSNSTAPGHALDVTARTADERAVPLAMTLSPIGDGTFSAAFRDVTTFRQMQDELRGAKRETMRAGAAKAEFLSKVSHEIRTPLNAMTGFAEVIMAERFGPIGNERYREYVKDIHNAGTHLVSMLNDLLDLSKVETGQVELTFNNVNLNELTQQCVGIMQPQANRARIIIRTSLTPNLPKVVADERSLRQIVLNLLANSIRYTGPGGQVIVSTVFSDAQEAVLRVRDTGAGMTEKDIQAALEPFAQTAVSGSFGSGGSGFGLPLTKALAEANRAHFSIKSAPNAGTLVEVAFPPSRIVTD